MAVVYGERVAKVPVRPGPEGEAEFKVSDSSAVKVIAQVVYACTACVPQHLFSQHSS
jgi:hypothetical protein